MSSEIKKGKSEQPLIVKYYRVQGSTVNRLKKDCPRCGKGVFMAEHEDRFSCGKCGYTQWKKKD